MPLRSLRGTTKARTYSIAEGYDQGTYIFNLNNGATLDLNGDVNIVAIHSDEQVPDIGNNVFYSFGEGSTINIGKEGGTTKAWALAEKPDLISAKNGGVVNVRSTNNQFVGSIDFIDESLGTRGSSVTAKFDGSDSFWFGELQNLTAQTLFGLEMIRVLATYFKQL